MTAPDGVLLRTERLTRSFGSLTAVNAVGLTVRQGELRSIIGPNGAGKTTFFRLVSGEMAPSLGARGLPGGRTSPGCPSAAVCRLGIAKSYQITNIFPHLSVLENVRVAVQGRARSFNFWSRADRLRGLPRARGRDPRHGRASTRQAERLAAHLSHGEKRHLEIGIALASDPALLLLDEPTAGMSPEETDETMVLIRELARGRTVVLVEHKMKLVMGDLGPRHRAAPGRGARRRHAGGDPRRTELVQETYLGASR